MPSVHRSSFRVHHFFLLHCLAKGKRRREGAASKVAKEKGTKVTNEISDGTGQFDARFVLWRQFCGDNDIPVETLPSALTGEIKEKWEHLKNERLRKSDK